MAGPAREAKKGGEKREPSGTRRREDGQKRNARMKPSGLRKGTVYRLNFKEKQAGTSVGVGQREKKVKPGQVGKGGLTKSGSPYGRERKKPQKKSTAQEP